MEAIADQVMWIPYLNTFCGKNGPQVKLPNVQYTQKYLLTLVKVVPVPKTVLISIHPLTVKSKSWFTGTASDLDPSVN
jgi:hypothetical protein